MYILISDKVYKCTMICCEPKEMCNGWNGVDNWYLQIEYIMFTNSQKYLRVWYIYYFTL